MRNDTSAEGYILMAASIFACNHIVNCKLHCHEIEKSYLLPVRALIALAASAMFACSDDDEGFADLAVDSPSLEIQAGQTGLVRILAGSGEYACTGNDPQIADVQLAEQTISVRGLASGSTSFAVEDTRTGQSVSVDVTVSPVVRRRAARGGRVRPMESGYGRRNRENRLLSRRVRRGGCAVGSDLAE